MKEEECRTKMIFCIIIQKVNAWLCTLPFFVVFFVSIKVQFCIKLIFRNKLFFNDEEKIPLCLKEVFAVSLNVKNLASTVAEFRSVFIFGFSMHLRRVSCFANERCYKVNNSASPIHSSLSWCMNDRSFEMWKTSFP